MYDFFYVERQSHKESFIFMENKYCWKIIDKMNNVNTKKNQDVRFFFFFNFFKYLLP